MGIAILDAFRSNTLSEVWKLWGWGDRGPQHVVHLLVCLYTILGSKQTFCRGVSISERPGGLVPPGQIVDKQKPYHDRRNAQIAFRDKGTPIPDHLK